MIVTVTLNPSLDEWITIPSWRVGALTRATAFARYPGGKGINVARVIHVLKGETVAVALAGGEDGAILRALLQRRAVPHEFIAVDGSTRNNYKIRTLHPRALTELNTPGPRATPAVLRLVERRLLQRRPRFRCAVFSGSLPPGAPASVYARWVRRLRRRGIPSVVDTSGEALRRGTAARPWLIKPNRHEAEELLRTRLTRLRHVIEAARALLARGPQVVMLSLGKEGALLACASVREVWMARPPRVMMDAAVGAGDSLVGGFLAGWQRGASRVEALRLGVACGTATAMTPGTELCRRADVRRLLPRVRVKRIA